MRVPLMILLLLLSLCLVVLYPMSFGSTQMWLIFSVVLSMQLRDSLCQRMGRLCLDGRMEQTTFLCLSGALHGCMMALQALILAVNLPVQLSVPMMIGYLLCGMAAFYSTYAAYEERAVLPRPNLEEAHFTLETIHRANALSAFERLSMVLLTAMEMTLIVMYTFLATTAEQMLIRMAIAVLTTLLCEELATLLLKKREKKNKNESISLLLMGMFLWLYGLWIFFADAAAPHDGYQHHLLLSGALLRRLRGVQGLPEQDGKPDGRGREIHLRAGNSRLSADAARVARSGFAAGADACACGADGAVLPCWAAAAAPAEEIAASFQPVMVVPALITAFIALLCVLRFPLSNRYMQKVLRFLHIRESGEENKALEQQLEEVVIKRHVQPLGIRFLMAVMRPFFRHTVKGAENIHPDDSNPLVFLCNHGEIYGPVAGCCSAPCPCARGQSATFPLTRTRLRNTSTNIHFRK